ncbi:MAG: hypothetical protein JXO22_09415, partial [Phycisphaerae bacterium]|nr:hypothetical protein [Phycisphaerae bacterium]
MSTPAKGCADGLSTLPRAASSIPRLPRGAATTVALLTLVLLTACDSKPRATDATDGEKNTTPAATVISRGPATFDDGWTRGDRPRVFTQQDLFNHIDGAAELFIELGFKRVIVESYARGNDKFDLELYEMDTPTAARALFYRVRGDGEPLDGVTGRNVGGPYQVAIQKNRYYAQINNFDGEERCIPDMVSLA